MSVHPNTHRLRAAALVAGTALIGVASPSGPIAASRR
jgi:hypothetical protein